MAQYRPRTVTKDVPGCSDCSHIGALDLLHEHVICTVVEGGRKQRQDSIGDLKRSSHRTLVNSHDKTLEHVKWRESKLRRVPRVCLIFR